MLPINIILVPIGRLVFSFMDILVVTNNYSLILLITIVGEAIIENDSVLTKLTKKYHFGANKLFGCVFHVIFGFHQQV